MNISKLLVGTAAAALVLAVQVSSAQAEYPDKPVTLIVPFGAGGATDGLARAILPALQKAVGADVVVKNVSGGGGTIGAAHAASAKNNGYSIFLSPVAPVTVQPHMRNLPYDVGSFEPICRVSMNPVALHVKKSSPYHSMADVIAAAKANPGKLTYASSGAGTIPHVLMTTFVNSAKLKIKHVPFKGGSAKVMKGLLGGEVDLFADVTSLATRFDTRMIALFNPSRISEFANLKTAKEQGHDLSYAIWFGMFAPKGTSAGVIKHLATACGKMLKAPASIKAMSNAKRNIAFLSGDDFKNFVSSEYKKNAEFTTIAGLNKSQKK